MYLCLHHVFWRLSFATLKVYLLNSAKEREVETWVELQLPLLLMTLLRCCCNHQTLPSSHNHLHLIIIMVTVHMTIMTYIMDIVLTLKCCKQAILDDEYLDINKNFSWRNYILKNTKLSFTIFSSLRGGRSLSLLVRLPRLWTTGDNSDIDDNNDDPVEDNDKLFLMCIFSKMMTLMVIRGNKNVCMLPSFQFEFDKAKHLEKKR